MVVSFQGMHCYLHKAETNSTAHKPETHLSQFNLHYVPVEVLDPNAIVNASQHLSLVHAVMYIKEQYTVYM